MRPVYWRQERMPLGPGAGEEASSYGEVEGSGVVEDGADVGGHGSRGGPEGRDRDVPLDGGDEAEVYHEGRVFDDRKGF